MTKSARTAAWDTGRRRSLREESAGKRAVEKALRGKLKQIFNSAWKSRKMPGIPTFPQPRGDDLSTVEQANGSDVVL